MMHANKKVSFYISVKTVTPLSILAASMFEMALSTFASDHPAQKATQSYEPLIGHGLSCKPESEVHACMK